ncbi:MAG: hypothetical protein EOP43_05660 [Sphingobacteriaceae bacterium]|nr:MAG: hypothetical protein EOP43_05660 [Sphingobacteriaceae bacterium]
MDNILNVILLMVAVVLSLNCVRVVWIYWQRYRNSKTITFQHGDKRITVSRNYTLEDSKKLMHL